jgi:hypothetical protein
MSRRNFGLRSRNQFRAKSSLPAYQRGKLGGTFESRPFSSDLKEIVAGGFLISFAVLCGSLFGVITFFASMLLEPSLDLQAVQYDHHFQLDRHPG